ncbi:MAG TPA: TIGR00730 family Rossman fold protein [Dehalococcoidia bacterium]|nr:TIGR00730 family Rossman fold protein [Dehalococcoidia bacterium]
MANLPTNQPADQTPPEDDLPHDERGDLEPLEPQSRRARGPVYRRVYTTGNQELDRQINDVIGALTYAVPGDDHHIDPADLELTREMLTSSVRLVLQKASRAELKLVNASLKEFAYAFRVFAPYRDLSKVTIFGSARVQPGEAEYVAARDFASQIANKGWMVITGAGPGIMAAGHEGAGAEHSFGANIRLPGLNPANAYIAKDGKLINFKYFFTRKVTFLKESDAFVLMPGGWGTLDECFELLTLAQTGKSGIHPIVLLEPQGSTYWRDWLLFIRDNVLARGFIYESDLALLRVASTPEEAVEEIQRFYSNFHSARFVGERLVLRVKRAPTPEQLARLNLQFDNLTLRGEIEVIEPLQPEVRDNDHLEYQRVALYPWHAYGLIRQLIDELNAL